jgi:phosphoenolpyruvate carboxylase
MNHPTPETWRREIGFLGSLLGDTIRQFGGDAAFELVEEFRRLAWDRRAGRESGDARLKQLIATLDDEQVRLVVRAFTTFLDLLNLVEDRRRIQVLDQRTENAFPEPRSESIRDAIGELKSVGLSPEQMQTLVDRIDIELVFTAHPTEAKRRSVRSKLRSIRRLLAEYHAQTMEHHRLEVEREIRGEIAKLWHTDFIRPWRPSVMQEVGRGLSIKSVLWETLPKIHDDFRMALREHFGEATRLSHPCIHFGSWIGGDRDGHPGVTADVTAKTLLWLRREAIEFHLRTCDALSDSLSLSDRQVHFGGRLRDCLAQAEQRWPELDDRLAQLPPDELCRRWLSIIRWRLDQVHRLAPQNIETSQTPPSTPSAGTLIASASDPNAYQTPAELIADLDILIEELGRLPGAELLVSDVRAWRTQTETFGFHLAKLDVRQNASVYSEVINELLRKTMVCETPESLSEGERIDLLTRTLGGSWSIVDHHLSDTTREALAVFRTLHHACDREGLEAIGAHVISMTSAPSDVLSVLWLWEHTRGESDLEHRALLPIAPLLETIEDLENGPGILRQLLATPVYREQLRKLGDRQMIMLGYSDSTKDGGYLSACWSLYVAQKNLVEVAREFGVEVLFFHGRGGSLGRGGGPAARSILSLPRGTFAGKIRITEQGEVLSNRYDDPAIAYRHLEQLVWSSLLAAGDPSNSEPESWDRLMQELSSKSFSAYRELVEHDGFVRFFRHATPISEIEQLPIGSRPSRRKPDGGLSDLRAIPWVFSWTQSRCLLPAWYGLGSAFGEALQNSETRKELRSMYQRWPFFRAMIDNAELALAKSDLDIATKYFQLARDDAQASALSEMIVSEYRASCRAVLQLTERKELLDGTLWLKESIRVRNRFIDPLNFIQVELLQRLFEAADAEQQEELRHLTRLTINGIAAGMRTSG